MKILGLSGSLRKGSFNTALLHAAAEATAPPAALWVHGIVGVPIYDGDVEARGIPETVVSLKDLIAEADGLLIATPEYNHSIPGPLKNALDWCSRPPSDIARVFREKPVALCGATPGRGGTLLSQTAWLPVFRTLGLRYWPKQLLVPTAHEAFADGKLVDTNVRERLGEFVSGFVSFCEETAGRSR